MTLYLALSAFILAVATTACAWALCAMSGRCSREEEIDAAVERALILELSDTQFSEAAE